MKLKRIILFSLVISCQYTTAQSPADVYVKDAMKINRVRLYQNLVKNTITKNLSLPLTDSTEENWMDAFYAIQLTRYTSPWTENRVRSSFASIERRSDDFRFSLLELVYDIYPKILQEP